MSSRVTRAGCPPQAIGISECSGSFPTWQNGGRGFVGPSQLHCGSGCRRDTREKHPVLGHGALILRWGKWECVFANKSPAGEKSKGSCTRPRPVVLPRAVASSFSFIWRPYVLRWDLGVGKPPCPHGLGEGHAGFELFLPESLPSGHRVSRGHPGPASTAGVALGLEVR